MYILFLCYVLLFFLNIFVYCAPQNLIYGRKKQTDAYKIGIF